MEVIKIMDVKLVPLAEEEFDSLFTVVKQGLHTHVEAAFGWCDRFQRQRLKTDYQPQWFYWAYVGGERVALLCFKPYDNALHIHLLIVFPEFQNQKLGTRIMQHVHELARVQGRDAVTLSSFTSNQSAIRFYQSLGYKVIQSDHQFQCLSFAVSS